MMSFQENSQRALNNPNLQAAHQRATAHYFKARERSTQGLDLETLREDCRKIRQDSLDHLDRYLLQFEEAFQKGGGIVLWAQDAEQARELVLQICREHGVRKVVKGKSMVTEEIELNAFLEKNGIGAMETDLGEYIVQLAGEKPSHLTAPAIHKTREQIATLFHEKLGAPPGLNPEQLVEVARVRLRDQFFKAEAGITGANFLIAETGALILVENEGNIGMSTTTPPIHIAVVGMEKVIPRTQDLALLLRVLARSATGQKMTSYVSLIQHASEHCVKRFVILLDNGRSQMLADPKMQAALRCIHCGACLNVCPIYQRAGGHSYNSIYPGPIGAIWSPLLFDTPEAQELPFASSLCGACAEVCPVKIPMPHLFLELRRRWAQKRTGLNLHLENVEKTIFSSWAFLAKSPFLYRAALETVATAQKWFPWSGSILKRFPILSRWAEKRGMPQFSSPSFTEWWKKREL
ncbi:MAG: lactate utilization protein [Deltaproteobacteria bacterium]|nr:lactate utilization protein [Deltaproteobacteria bacterium]